MLVGAPDMHNISQDEENLPEVIFSLQFHKQCCTEIFWPQLASFPALHFRGLCQHPADSVRQLVEQTSTDIME